MRFDESLLPNWSSLRPDEFEDLVTMLLMDLHPHGKRFDGAGGDGGVDFLVSGPNGDVVFQIKHFPDRFNASQRRQVRRSIDSVLVHPHRTGRSLTGWILVVPRNLTTAEDQKLHELCQALPVPAQWFGETWLNNELSKRRHLLFARLQAGAARALAQQQLADLSNPIVGLQDVLRGQQTVRSHAAALSADFDVFTSSGGPEGGEFQ